MYTFALECLLHVQRGSLQRIANSLLQSTSTFFLPVVKGGIFTSAIAILSYSSQVKPLSAKIMSPIKLLYMYNYKFNISTSIYQEEGNSEVRTVPQSLCQACAHPYNETHRSLWCNAYQKCGRCFHICALARRSVGRSTKTSEQSNIFEEFSKSNWHCLLHCLSIRPLD